MPHVARTLPAGIAAAALLLALPAAAQTSPLGQRTVTSAVDSGWVDNDGGARAAVFSALVSEPGAPWMRLRFDQAALGTPPPGGEPTLLQLTALTDGAVQWLDATSLWQWGYASAYFNGDAVLVEIVADPGAEPSRVAIGELIVGEPAGGVATICGDDDRKPSNDPRAGRVVPNGCTAWIFDDANHCLLSAGHCFPGGEVVEFNVPLSNGGGGIQHPPVEDQYPIDSLSRQSVNGGIGNDWAYFGCHPNSNTGMTPYQSQGAFYELATVAPFVEGQPIRITGFGTDSSPPQWNQIQQTNSGPLVDVDDSAWGYEVDTEGGNSGSAVLDETTDLAIGIHTNGGCNFSGGFNIGTSVLNAQLQQALANPQGVCMPIPGAAFVFPDGLPESVLPGGDVIRVEVVGTENGDPQPGSAQMFLDAGSGFEAAPMIEVATNVYDALVPATSCGTSVSYYFSVQTTDEETVAEPAAAPDSSYQALSADVLEVVFADDFEKDLGWLVVDDPGLDTGSWEVALPVGGGDRGDPPFDADGSGRCALTGPLDGDYDIDGGATTLFSPMMDASIGTAYVQYWRWYSNTSGDAPMADTFLVELSDDNGLTWTGLETVGPDGDEVFGGWYRKTFPIADFVKPTAQLRIRFTASDLGAGSIVEAAVDGVRLISAVCAVCDGGGPGPCPCSGDVAQPPDGVVDVQDLTALILAWETADPAADITDDGTVDVADLTALVLQWGPCE